MYETFEHTADLGLRVRAADLETLFAEAGRGLVSILVDKLDDIRPEHEAKITVDGSQTDYLLFDWLNELLYRCDSGHWLFCDFTVQLNESGLTATARGETYDPGRHRLSHEVKAITYHQLRVELTDDGWLAEVIVDI